MQLTLLEAYCYRVKIPQTPEARMMSMMTALWPFGRSLTGPGVTATLACIGESCPDLQIHTIDSGTPVFDWTVPMEWTVWDAYLVSPRGEKLLDYRSNNLHLVGYSEPVDCFLDLPELQKRLHSIPEQPEAIPYVTSYYEKTWGFCLTQKQRDGLEPGTYRAVIKSSLHEGKLQYGEIFIKGELEREIFLSTYICHPSMANNELSGPVLAAELANWIGSQNRKYSYRIVFLPETIGALVYLQRNLESLKKRMLAGYVLTCVGDNRAFSYIPSRDGKTVADRFALRTADKLKLDVDMYTWWERGSDERQYCSPGADLPVCSVMRSKYGTYPEYHTSLDTIGEVVTPEGLRGSYDFYVSLIAEFENSDFPRLASVGELQLGKLGMYRNISKRGSSNASRHYLDICSLCDGNHSLEEIAELAKVEFATVKDFVERMVGLGKATFS